MENDKWKMTNGELLKMTNGKPSVGVPRFEFLSLLTCLPQRVPLSLTHLLSIP
jgi:hypothetical protein